MSLPPAPAPRPGELVPVVSYDVNRRYARGAPDDRHHATALQDLRHGPDRHGDERPDELARRQGRLAKIREARESLEERSRIEAAEEAARREAGGKSPPKVPPSEVVPGPKDQINFTDPEPRILKSRAAPHGRA